MKSSKCESQLHDGNETKCCEANILSELKDYEQVHDPRKLPLKIGCIAFMTYRRKFWPVLVIDIKRTTAAIVKVNSKRDEKPIQMKLNFLERYTAINEKKYLKESKKWKWKNGTFYLRLAIDRCKDWLYRPGRYAGLNIRRFLTYKDGEDPHQMNLLELKCIEGEKTRTSEDKTLENVKVSKKGRTMNVVKVNCKKPKLPKRKLASATSTARKQLGIKHNSSKSPMNSLKVNNKKGKRTSRSSVVKLNRKKRQNTSKGRKEVEPQCKKQKVSVDNNESESSIVLKEPNETPSPLVTEECCDVEPERSDAFLNELLPILKSEECLNYLHRIYRNEITSKYVNTFDRLEGNEITHGDVGIMGRGHMGPFDQKASENTVYEIADFYTSEVEKLGFVNFGSAIRYALCVWYPEAMMYAYRMHTSASVQEAERWFNSIGKYKKG